MTSMATAFTKAEMTTDSSKMTLGQLITTVKMKGLWNVVESALYCYFSSSDPYVSGFSGKLLRINPLGKESEELKFSLDKAKLSKVELPPAKHKNSSMINLYTMSETVNVTREESMHDVCFCSKRYHCSGVLHVYSKQESLFGQDVGYAESWYWITEKAMEEIRNILIEVLRQ